MTSCKSAGNLLAKTMALAAGLVLSFAAAAKTTTWKGGAEGDFATAGNWTDGAPESGDTVVFAGSDAVKITGNFDIGASGITLDNACAVNSYVAFSGKGKFTKKGAGVFTTVAWTTFSGGTRVENGRLTISNDFNSPYNLSQQFGSGEIELVRYSDSAPTLWYGGGWYKSFLNDIRITGAITAGDGAIRCGNPNQFIDGKITADSDFLINVPGGFGGVKLRGDIEAPGHTVLVFALPGGSTDFKFVEFSGKVNANVRKITTDTSYTWQGNGVVQLTGTSTVRDATLINDWHGALLLSETASWSGNVEADGATAGTKGVCTIDLNASANLSPVATVTLRNGAKLAIAAGVSCEVSALFLDGQPQPDGTYDKNSLSEWITGEGELVVMKRKLWTGGAEGDIAEPSNWSDGRAPDMGDYLVFLGTEPVKLTGTLALGVGELKIDKACEIDNYVKFSGEGKLVLLGGGTFDVHEQSVHTGGTQVKNGELRIADENFHGPWSEVHTCFGLGEIELVRYSDSLPRLYHRVMKQLTNNIRITGAITGGLGAIECGSPNNVFTGKITADSDFLINCEWGGVKFTNEINAPGHAVLCYVACDASNWGGMIFAGPVNAELKKIRSALATANWQGQLPLVLAGVSTNADSVLNMEWAKAIVLTNTCEWAGTNIIVNGSAAQAAGAIASLQIQSRKNLSKDAIIRLQNGGFVEVFSGVNAKVAELYVDGQRQPDGVYTAASLPAAIAGEGRLTVGRMGLFFIVK